MGFRETNSQLNCQNWSCRKYNIENYIEKHCQCPYNINGVSFNTSVCIYEYNNDIVIYLNKKYDNILHCFGHVIDTDESWVIILNLKNNIIEDFTRINLNFCPIYCNDEELFNKLKSTKKAMILK